MPRTLAFPSLDRMAVGLSGLCVLHCVLSVVLVAILSGATTFLTDPLFHRLGLVGAVILAAVAMGQGFIVHRDMSPLAVGMVGLSIMVAGLFVPHGWVEVMLTVAGVSIVAVAHFMNARARRAE